MFPKISLTAQGGFAGFREVVLAHETNLVPMQKENL